MGLSGFYRQRRAKIIEKKIVGDCECFMGMQKRP